MGCGGGLKPPRAGGGGGGVVAKNRGSWDIRFRRGVVVVIVVCWAEKEKKMGRDMSFVSVFPSHNTNLWSFLKVER